MPQWSAVQKRELVQALEACGEGQWIDAVIDWDDTVPSDEPELVSALAAIGIKQASLAAVALVVATVAATEPSTMPRPPSPEAAVTTTRTDPTSSSDGRTDEFDIISDVRDDVSRARPFADDSSDDSAVTDSDSDTGCGAVEQLTFETVVQAVNDASTGARNVQEDVIVALAGPTGAGKSTLRHFLHGDVLCVRGRAKGRNCQRIDVEEGPSRIGHDCSYTKEPETRRLDDTVTTVDLPGGSDTGGRVVQLRNGVMNALVLSPPGREVRLVLVLPFDIIEADRGGSLMRHLEDFEALFENIPDALQGVRIVVSRLHKRWDLDKYEGLSQREAAERVLMTIEPLMRRKHAAGGQLLNHMHDGLRETAFRCQGPDARFGWCMVFNPLDAASRPAMVEAIVGGAPVRGPPGCRAFRPSLPHDVAVEIDGMLRAAREQFDTDLGAGNARAAAQHLSKVTTVMGVLGEVGLLPQHRDLPQRMALSASRHINDEQPDLLRRVNEGDAHGVAAALERIGFMSDALGVAVRAAAPTAPCMTRAEALVLCEEQVTRGLSGEASVADASMVLHVASASLAVARILDTATTRAAADDFTRRLESAVKDAVVVMSATTHAFEMAARYSKILTAVQEWSSVLPTLVEYRSVARHAVVSTVRDIISRAQAAVHDGASGGVGLQKALEALNDCAGCGDLRSIVVDDVDVLGERDAVHAVLEVESTVVDDSDAPAVVGAAERNRSLLRLDGPNKLDLVRQRSELRLVVKKAAQGCKNAVVAKLERYLADQRETATRMQPGASQSDTEGPPCNYGLQEDDPVFDLLTLAQADTHLGCAHVTTALEACAAKIKATFDLSLGAFQSDLVTPGAYATFVHLPSIMAAPVLPTACDLQELPRGVQAALRSIETTIDTAKERCREFVRSCLCSLRDRLPTAEQVEAGPYSKTMARTFDDTSAALRLFAKPEYREVCAETRVLLDTAVEGVKQRVTTPLHDDPLSASAAKTVTGCILPLLATSTFQDDGLPEMVAAWLARASEKVSVAGPCRIKALQVLESELRFTTAGQQLCALDAGCAALCKDAIAKIASLSEKREQRIIAVRAEAERLNRDAFSSAIALVDDLPSELQEQGADAVVKVASTVMGMIRAAIQAQQLSSVRSEQHAWFMGLRSVMETDRGSHHLRRVTDQWAQLAEFMATESSFIHSALEKALQACDQARIQQCWGQWSSLEVLRDPTAVRRELGAVALEAVKGRCADGPGSIASIGAWVQYLIHWSGMTAIAPQFPQVERWLTDGIADAVKALETGLSQENVADVQRRSEMCRELQELVGSMEQVVALRPSTQAVNRLFERLSAFDQETGDKIEDHLDHSKFAEAVKELPRLRDHQRADAANIIGVSVREVISQPTRTASDMQCLRRFVEAVGSDPSWRSLRKQASKFGAAFRDAERQVSEEFPAMKSALTETVDRSVAALADMKPSSDAWAGLFKAAEECKILELTALNGALSAAAKEYTTTLHRYITGLGKALVAHDVGSLNLKAIATALPYLSCFPEGGVTQLCDSFLKRHHLEKTLHDDLTSSHVDSASADCVAMLDQRSTDVSAAVKRVAFWTTMREHFGASIPALQTGANVEPAVVSWASDQMANAQSNYAAPDLAAFHKRFFSVSGCANAARVNGLMGLAAQLDNLMRPLRQTYESDVEQRAAAISSADDTTQTVQSVIVLRDMAVRAPVLHTCVTRAVASVFERLAPTSASFNVFLEQLSAKATEDSTANVLTVENEKYFRTAQRKVWKKLHAGASDLTKVIAEFDSEPPLDKNNLLETIKQFSSDLDKHTSECFAKPTMNEVRQAAAQKATAALQKCRSSLSTKNLRRLLLTVCVTLSAVFSDSHDENERLRLHDAQIIALLRALDVEDTSSFLKAKGDDAVGYLRTLKGVLRRIPNHMVQVLTGEGKSYALGVLAAVFALLGARVHVACFSPYLTGRDAQALLPLFTLLGVADRVLYRTIDDVCEMHFSKVRDAARHVFETRSFPPSAQQQSSEDDSLPLVLLADEADVLFHLRFFGATFDAGFVLIGPEISALIKEVYENRGKPYNVRESNAFAAVVARYPGTEAVLRVVAQQLVDNSTRYDKAPANEFLWVPEKKRIGYKLAHGDDYDTNVVYPNMTQFAYLQFVEQHKCTATDAAPHLGLHLHCGHLSYAHMLASKYELIVGVTGTLKQAPTAVSVPHGVKPGDWILTTEEMKYLRDLFKVTKFSFVPSLYGRSQNKFNDVDVWPLNEWAQKIDAAIDHVSEDGAALVFFENDIMLKEFRAGRGKHSDIEAVTEAMPAGARQGYIANATRKTKVTAFTQAYARGVDFPCRRGALVTVIATYLPATTSEEIQMFGRTARQGREGAVRMILCTEHLQAKFGPLAAELPTQAPALAVSLRELRAQKMKKQDQGREKRLKAALASEKASEAVLNVLRSGIDPVQARQAVCRATIDNNRAANEAFVLVLDSSASMKDDWPKVINATSGIQELLKRQGRGNTTFIVVLFGDRAQIETRSTAASVKRLRPFQHLGATNYADAFAAAHTEIRQRPNNSVTLLFLTDGLPNRGFDVSAHVGPLLAGERDHLAAFHIVSFCTKEADIPPVLADVKREAVRQQVRCVLSNAVDETTLKAHFAATTASNPMHV